MFYKRQSREIANAGFSEESITKLTTKVWTKEKLLYLIEWYPTKGKMWCANNLSMTESQIRQKASHLSLRVNGHSEAWLDGQIRAAQSKTGKKNTKLSERLIADRDAGLRIWPKLSEQAKNSIGEKARKRIACNGHPRGALGLKHSDETRRKISEKSIQHSKSETKEARDCRILKGLLTRAKNGTLTNTNRHCSSWKAGWREIGSKRKYFRSRWEANYARYLDLLKKNGNILEWEHEAETFWFEGVKRGCVSYLPDYRVTMPDGSVEYHEVKGWMDDRSKTKIKRMAKYHPDIILVVIGKSNYVDIKNKLSRIIEGWEH